MAKAPAFQLYVNDALRDTRVLSLESRGAWWDCLLMMWNAPQRGVLEFTIDQYSRLFGTDLGTAERCISEIESTGVADVVRSSNGDVTVIRVINRRMAKERKALEQGRERVNKHRRNARDSLPVTEKKRDCNANVTPPSSSSPSASVTNTHNAGAKNPTDLESRILEVLAYFNISTSIATIGNAAMDAFMAQPQFLEDEAIEVIKEKAGPWRSQDWIRDVNPRFIAERLAEIYHYQPNGKRGSKKSTAADRDREKTGLNQVIELPKL